MRLAVSLVVVGLLATACFGPDPNLTESGKGRPEVALVFPAEVAAGSTQELNVRVANPGPGDIPRLFLVFTAVGVGGSVVVPPPIVAPGRNRSPSVVSVDPEPRLVEQNGTLYDFGPLDEGESMTVSFRLRMPSEAGTYANSVQAYDAQESDRSRGVRLQTEVTG